MGSVTFQNQKCDGRPGALGLGFLVEGFLWTGLDCTDESLHGNTLRVRYVRVVSTGGDPAASFQ
eukprot:940912-Pyramimonas_sp.AAC.1